MEASTEVRRTSIQFLMSNKKTKFKYFQTRNKVGLGKLVTSNKSSSVFSGVTSFFPQHNLTTMLSPEVWHFEPPPSFTNYDLVGDGKELWNTVANQYFNHFVSVTVPDALHIHPRIRTVLSEDSEFYYIYNVYAYEFVKSEFINLFVEKGELTLLSIDTNLDQDDCIVITPKGKLLLSLCRTTYQELGIDGKPSAFSNKIADKYVVSIDLCEKCFKPGKKNYERVLERLKEKNQLCFNVILAWEPHKSEICPSSIAAYLSCQGYKVETCHVNIKERLKYNVSVPIFDDESEPQDLAEWLGAFNLGCDIPEKANGFVTSFESPERHVKFGQVVYLEAVGLFTVTRLKKLVEEIKNYVTTLSESAWLGLNVNGFEDAVVNRGNQEHFFYSTGDYHYTMFFRNQGPTLLCIHTSSSRRPKTSTKKKKRKYRKN